MADLSTASLGSAGGQPAAPERAPLNLDNQISAQSLCNFESALKLAAEFFNQQQQQYLNQQRLFNPYLHQHQQHPHQHQQHHQHQASRRGSSASSQSSLLSTSQPDLAARHPILSQSSGAVDLPNQLAFLQQQQQQHNQRDTDAAALHVHLLLQSQVS